MERTIKECDRCLTEIKGPYYTFEISYHHPVKLLICSSCEKKFPEWLGRHPLFG